MNQRIVLWHYDAGAAAERRLVDIELDGKAFLSPAGVSRAADEEAAALADHAVVMPAAVEGDYCAVMIVPEILSWKIRLNDAPAPAGLHVLKPRDKIEVSVTRHVWIGDPRARVQVYDPDIHGKDVFCARTRARLQSGARIVVCPTLRCGAIYTEKAYGLCVPCHKCGSNPVKEEWRPVFDENACGSLDSLLARIKARKTPQQEDQ
jgi:hypothetical protein